MFKINLNFFNKLMKSLNRRNLRWDKLKEDVRVGGRKDKMDWKGKTKTGLTKICVNAMNKCRYYTSNEYVDYT